MVVYIKRYFIRDNEFSWSRFENVEYVLTTIEVHYKRIKEITPQGLFYIDEGETHYIDFL
jgi:hypothetical protein